MIKSAHQKELDSNNKEWHLEWEEGPCHFIDDNGEQKYHDKAWHKHPLGTEYAELFK